MKVVVVALACVVGCGDGGASSADDGGGTDTSGSGDQVRVTVYDQSHAANPLVGAAVYFRAPDGTTQKVATDATGVAAASSPADTTVFVLQTAPSVFIRAYTGLAPGDAFVSGPNDTDDGALPVIGNVTVSLTPMQGATSYTVHMSCGPYEDMTQTHSISLAFQPCAHQHAGEVLATAYTGSTLVGYAGVKDVDLAAHVGIPNASVALPAFAALTPLTATITNPLAPATLVGMHVFYDDKSYATNRTLVPPTALVGASTTLSTVVAPFGDDTQFQIQLFTGPSDETGIAMYRGFLPGVPTTLDVDVGSPMFAVRSVTFDQVSRTFTWTDTPGGMAANFVHATAVRPDGETFVTYELVTSPGMTPSIQLPELPADLAQYAPPATGAINWQFVRYLVPSGYRAGLVGGHFFIDSLIGVDNWQEPTTYNGQTPIVP